jgi:hypothetical protein
MMTTFLRAWLGIAVAVLLLSVWSHINLWWHGYSVPMLTFSNIAATLIVMVGAGLVGSIIFAIVHLRGRTPTFASCLAVGIILTFAPIAYQVFEAVRTCDNLFLICYVAGDLPINMRYDSFAVGIAVGWATRLIEACVIGLGAYLAVRGTRSARIGNSP